MEHGVFSTFLNKIIRVFYIDDTHQFHAKEGILISADSKFIVIKTKKKYSTNYHHEGIKIENIQRWEEVEG